MTQRPPISSESFADVHSPLLRRWGTPVRSSIELQKLSLVNSLFHFFESLIAHMQAVSGEIVEAEKRLSFELYGVHPFLRPSAATSNQRRQADVNNLESFFVARNQNQRFFFCFGANLSGFSAFNSLVRALINSCASVKPHSVTEIYRLVASILSPAAMAPTIFPNSSSVGSRFICSRD